MLSIFGAKCLNQFGFSFPLYSLAYFKTKEIKNQIGRKISTHNKSTLQQQ